MTSKERLKAIAEWVLPPRVQSVLEENVLWRVTRTPTIAAELKRNRALRHIHQGKRAFILCNGPSINAEDLTPLAGEICFSVSNFYKHQLYPHIHPAYHCVPNVLPPHTEEGTEQWFQEMHAEIGPAKLFLGTRQLPLVRRAGLFPGRALHFLHMSGSLTPTAAGIDISRGVARVISVPIMTLMIALYMGFDRIYLLGTDHSSLFTGEYHYFFDRSRMVLKDPYTNDDGRNNYALLLEFTLHLQLWKQYEALHQIARQRGVRITNLAQGSYLDVFPRGELKQVLA